jgi:hypothetical protein
MIQTSYLRISSVIMKFTFSFMKMAIYRRRTDLLRIYTQYTARVRINSKRPTPIWGIVPAKVSITRPARRVTPPGRQGLLSTARPRGTLQRLYWVLNTKIAWELTPAFKELPTCVRMSIDEQLPSLYLWNRFQWKNQSLDLDTA